MKTFSSLLLAAVLVSGCAKKAHNNNEIPMEALQEVTTPSGLKYIDLKIGEGPAPVIGQKVTVHYTGTFIDGRKFDSSLDRGEPFTFVIGIGQVIQGWDEGVASMKVGGKRKLRIPSRLAYGARGAGEVIPPNTDLFFDVELLEVQNR